MIRAVAALLLLALAATPAAAQVLPACLERPFPATCTPREQAATRDDWLAERFATILPEAMRAHGVDMWIIVAREYVEDPVLSTMLNATSFHARRRTILVLHDPGPDQPIERLTVSRYGLADFFQSAWDPEQQPDQWARLGEIIAARNPAKIAVNVSPDSAFADGLTKSQYDGVLSAVPENMRERVVPAYPLAIHWLETRLPDEITAYRAIVRLAHDLIAEGFSDAFITPGKTTADDVVWRFRARIAELGLSAWFHPSVDISRQGVDQPLDGAAIIQPGDLLWTDFGITYFGLNTDTQQMAYVLREGETDAPAGLRAGLKAANDVQDALTSSFQLGDSGNVILARARAKAIAQGLSPSIYSHPIGYHGHGAGASIGFWDNQNPDPRGDYPLRANTAWSIELSATHSVPEWGDQKIAFKVEEDAFFDGTRVDYLDGRQTRFHLIGAPR